MKTFQKYHLFMALFFLWRLLLVVIKGSGWSKVETDNVRLRVRKPVKHASREEPVEWKKFIGIR